MSDEIKRALREAGAAVCEERNHPDYPCGRGDIDDNMAAAAIVAFLRAMDDWRPGVAIQPRKWAAAVEAARSNGEGMGDG
jgi:hypothetical protein